MKLFSQQVSARQSEDGMHRIHPTRATLLYASTHIQKSYCPIPTTIVQAGSERPHRMWHTE